MKKESKNEIQALLQEIRRPFLDLRFQELEAQWDFDELRRAQELNPEAIGEAAGRLMEIRIRMLKVASEFLSKRSEILGKTEGGMIRQMSPPPSFQVSGSGHDLANLFGGGGGGGGFTACVTSDDPDSYWQSTCYISGTGGGSYVLTYKDGSTQSIPVLDVSAIQ